MLTTEELIEALDDLALEWPKGVWLYVANGVLFLMRAGPNGEHMITGHGGVDPAYIITSFGLIPSDGGDW